MRRGKSNFAIGAVNHGRLRRFSLRGAMRDKLRATECPFIDTGCPSSMARCSR